MPASRCICYVEQKAFAAATLVARMEDKALDQAPIWDDVRTFNPGPWRGVVSGIVAGFPCQPVSEAGQRAGQEDHRWIFGEVMRVVRAVGARWVFLENVTGILSLGLGSVLGELARSGFDCEWMCLSAAALGAPHGRDRWWCLGYANLEGLEGCRQHINTRELAPWKAGPAMGATDGIFPPPPGSPKWEQAPPSIKPAICGIIDGAPSRVDRLQALGNSVVPLQAAVAFRELVRRATA